jgi:hypothetical protein
MRETITLVLIDMLMFIIISKKAKYCVFVSTVSVATCYVFLFYSVPTHLAMLKKATSAYNDGHLHDNMSTNGGFLKTLAESRNYYFEFSLQTSLT